MSAQQKHDEISEIDRTPKARRAAKSTQLNCGLPVHRERRGLSLGRGESLIIIIIIVIMIIIITIITIITFIYAGCSVSCRFPVNRLE